MNEFSPGVLGVGIQALLTSVQPFLGDRVALLDQLETVGTIAKTSDKKQRRIRAGNVLIGMSECRLFDLEAKQFTELGRKILDASSAMEAAREFSTHILQNLHGRTLVDVAREAKERGETLTGDYMRASLRARGYEVTTNEANSNKLRLWLEESGAVDSKWNFNEELLLELGGFSSSILKEFGRLTSQQIVLLNKIREQTITAPADAWLELSPILELIDLEFGKNFVSESRLRALVVKPLSNALWIEARGTGRNQGGNAGEVRALQKLLALSDEIPLPSEAGIPADLRPKLSISPDSIFKDLKSQDTYTKGVALELLALNILISIGLRPVGFRLRASEAAGVETDLTANGVHLHYSRWLVQCKNTSELKHEHVAREIGLATILRSHVILMISTGRVSYRAQVLANQAARQSHLQVLMIDGEVLDRFRAKGGSEVVAALRKQAEQVLTLKKMQDAVTTVIDSSLT